MNTLYDLILFWMVFIGGFAVIITVFDKSNAMKHKQRVPEKTLLLLGFLGGATAMFTAMLIIRHKTRHLKFMLLLPVFMLLHVMLLFLSYLYL